MSKLPAFQFYPGDWRKDPSLSRCSKAAKGVWIDMLCLMFECPVRGVLVDSGGKPWSDQEIAEAIGGPTGTNLECIAELLGKGVARRDNRGAIFSRRLVRDEETRRATKQRVQKHRSNANGNASVTPKYEDEKEDEVLAKELPKISLAQKVAGEMCLKGPGVIQEIAGAIEFLEKHDNRSPNAAVELLVAEGKKEIARGGAPDRFWFASRKWRQPAQPRMTREDLARKQAFEEAERKDRAKGAGV